MLLVVDMWTQDSYEQTSSRGEDWNHTFSMHKVVEDIIRNYDGEKYFFNSGGEDLKPHEQFADLEVIQNTNSLPHCNETYLVGPEKTYLCGMHLGRCIDNLVNKIANPYIILNACVIHSNDTLYEVYDEEYNYVWYNYRDKDFTDIEVRFK